MGKKIRTAVRSAAVAAAALAVALMVPVPSMAAVLRVPSDYPTIQSAVDHAQDGDKIRIAAGTYLENLAIGKDVALEGAGAGSTFIDGSGAPDSTVLVTGDVTIEKVTIRGGSGRVHLPDHGITIGGGVENQGTLTLSKCVVERNTAESGGGIDNGGELILTDCTVRGNTATFSSGGGIYNYGGGEVTLVRTIVCGNEAEFAGAGIANEVGEVRLSETAVTGNVAGLNGWGEGAGVANSGELEIRRSLLSSNHANGDGGALSNWPEGEAELCGSCVEGNSGTAVLDWDPAVVEAEGNWWGACDGPSGEGPGSGDSVGAGVEYERWLRSRPVQCRKLAAAAEKACE